MSLTLSAAVRPPIASWLGAQLAREIDHGRLVFFLPGLAVVGVFAWAALPADPPLLWLALSVVGLLVLRVLAARSSLAALAPVALALAAVAAGALAIGAQSRLSGTAMLQRSQTATITGRVVAVEPRAGGGTRIVLAPLATSLTGAVPRRLRLAVRSGPPLAVGAVVETRARLFPVPGPSMPGGYDPGRRLYFDGIGATGFTYGPPQVVEPPSGGPAAWLARVRHSIAETILARGVPSAPFAVALLVGERGFMDPADVEALRVSGLGHILAISGLHMALFAGAVFASVRFALALVPHLALRWPIKKWAAIAGILAATAYLALSGASVATVRAYVMLLIGVVAILADRPVLTMRTVAIAATALIAIDPVSVMEPGFQMSFLAVIALIGAYEWWASRRVETRRRWPVAAFVIGLAATSLIAGLATTPMGLYHFHRLAPLGLVANLLVMPIFTLIAMPAGVLALFVMPFGLEGVPLAVMGGSLDVVLVLAHRVAQWTGSAGTFGAIPAASAGLAASGLVVLSVLIAPWRLAGAGLIALGLVLVPLRAPPDVLVAGDGRSIAARGPQGRLALAPTTSEFAGSMALRADGDTRPVKEARRKMCDGGGCTLPLSAGFLALPATPSAAREDCRRAAVVVSPDNLACNSPALVIDRAFLKRHGSVAARREGAKWSLVVARPYGFTRPWQVAPEIERR